MPKNSQHNGAALPWLLEPDSPGARYLALRDLVDAPKAAELSAARKAAHQKGPIANILRNMDDEGYWVRGGPGYNPKYRSATWSILTLAQLGGSIEEDEHIAKACAYMLDHGLAEGGQFTTTSSGAPSGTVDCLQGNLCWALLELGVDDPRLDQAFDWMARTVTGEGMASAQDRDAPRRYYAYKCGPDFACGVNAGKACAWGAVKVMLALGRLPEERRTPRIKRAIRRGIDFIFGVDPATALYPTRIGEKPNRAWWKFGFPVYYVTDLLQLVEALVALGYGNDRRLSRTLDIVREKRDAQGRWALEYDYTGKTWVDFGETRQPNKWVTLRALRVLKAVEAG
jgi:hypothetical protein